LGDDLVADDKSRAPESAGVLSACVASASISCGVFLSPTIAIKTFSGHTKTVDT